MKLVRGLLCGVSNNSTEFLLYINVHTMKTGRNSFKVASYSWIVVGVIGLILGLKYSDHKNVGEMALVFTLSGAFCGWVLGTIMDLIFGSPSVKNMGRDIADIQDYQEIIHLNKKSMAEYEGAKNRFQYLPNKILVEKFKRYQHEDRSDLIRLALEEELVERGVLTHSPMHVKFENIKSGI